MRTIEQIREDLAAAVESTSQWREDKAVEFPDDNRNKAAAKGLARIAEGLRVLPEHHAILEALCHRWSQVDDDTALRLSKAEAEYLQTYGFSHDEESPEEFLKGLHQSLVDVVFAERLRDHSISSAKH